MINFITKNTKKDDIKLFIPIKLENIVEEIIIEKFEKDEFEQEKENSLKESLLNSKKSYQHKSFIDLIENEIIETKNETFNLDQRNNFNVIENGDIYYDVNNIPENSNVIYQSEIKDFENGYLILGYENGNIAKFLISLYAPTSRNKLILKHGVRITGLKLIRFCEFDVEIAILSKNGKCIVFDTKNILNPIRTKSSLGEAKGVNIIKLKGRDIVEFFELAENTRLSINAREYFKKDSRAFGFYLRKNDEY